MDNGVNPRSYLLCSANVSDMKLTIHCKKKAELFQSNPKTPNPELSLTWIAFLLPYPPYVTMKVCTSATFILIDIFRLFAFGQR
jgi:hypothetical protein